MMGFLMDIGNPFSRLKNLSISKVGEGRRFAGFLIDRKQLIPGRVMNGLQTAVRPLNYYRIYWLFAAQTKMDDRLDT